MVNVLVVPEGYKILLIYHYLYFPQVITFDGGESPRMAGEFNELLSIPAEQWDILESIIKATKGSQLLYCVCVFMLLCLFATMHYACWLYATVKMIPVDNRLAS